MQTNKTDISGYVVTQNSESRGYPFIATIRSMLPVCDEIIVVDANSTDNTYKILQELAKTYQKINVIKRDFKLPSKQRASMVAKYWAYARQKCSKGFCLQMFDYEVLHEDHVQGIMELAKFMPIEVSIVALPVVRLWGNAGKIRIDNSIWQCRLSRNSQSITHGIPAHLRRIDENGTLYAAKGTAGVDYIHSQTKQSLPIGSHYTKHVHTSRITAMSAGMSFLKTGYDKDLKHVKEYQRLFSLIVENIPTVWDYSWQNIEAQIKNYRDCLQNNNEILYNRSYKNVFFTKPWHKVDNLEICELARKMEENLGGWQQNSIVDVNTYTPSIGIEMSEPGAIDVV